MNIPAKHSLALFLFYLGVAGLWLLPVLSHPNRVAFQPGIEGSDLLVSHMPYSVFIQRSLQTWHQIPLWNPNILSGAPLAADPLSGFWYLPNWIPHLLPNAWAFNLLFLLHVAWAGMGMHKFLREEGLGRIGATLGGVAYSGMPRLIGTIAMGQLSMVLAVSWTPWLLLGFKRTLQSSSRHRRPWMRDAALASIPVGMILLSDARWLPLAGLCVLGYAIRFLLQTRSTAKVRWASVIGAAGIVAVTSVALGAALVLPLGEFIRLSTRTGMSEADRGFMALPVKAIPGLVFPTLGGFGEFQLYPGITILILAVVALVGRARGAGYWGVLGLAALVLSLGSVTPFYALMSSLIPIIKLLRAPARFLFLLGFSMSILAGLGIERLIKGSFQARQIRWMRISMISLGELVLMVSIVLSLSRFLSGDKWTSPFLGVSIFATVAVISVLILLSERISGGSVGAIFAVIVTLDLMWINTSLMEMRLPPSRGDFAEMLGDCPGQDDGARTFSPSFSVPPEFAASLGIELAEGVNPLHLKSYWEFMSAATGFAHETYHVSIPPFAYEQSSIDWQPIIDARQLGLLSVSCLIASYPLDAEGIELIHATGDWYVYQNLFYRPRAWLEPLAAPASQEWKNVESLEWSPVQISARVNGPGRLVFSELAYPGWVARIDGRRAEIGLAHDILRTVEVPSGGHSVEISYRPWSIYSGAVISIATLMILIRIWLYRAVE